MKRRILLLFLALCLLAPSCSALAAAPSALTGITVDGVRTAFFGPDGAYLPPLEENGLIYVPAEALGEGLGLDVEADAAARVVRINGVTAAFFTPEGMYLPPLVEGGLVYVPLVPFCESVGVPVTVTGNTYALQRPQIAKPTASPTPRPTVTPKPTAAPTAQPIYGYVPLTDANFSDYFTVEYGYSHSNDSYKMRSFTIYHKLTVRAKTSYGLENVSFRAGKFGTVSMPSSGYAYKTYDETIYRYNAKSDTDWVWDIGNLKTKAILSGKPSISSVSGKLRMSFQEAQSINQGYYKQAESYLSRGLYDRAIELFTLLSRVDYADSADRIKEARTARSAAAKAEAERKEQAMAEKYEQAMAAMGKEDYDTALPLLRDLAKDKYRDSAEQLTKAETAIAQRHYAEAEALLARGEYQAASEAFAAAGSYKDAASRVREPFYKQAEALLAEGKYEEASKAFAEANHGNSAQRVGEPYYVQAEKLLAEEKYDEAIAAFGKASGYRDADARVQSTCLLKGDKLLAQGKYDEAIAAYEAGKDAARVQQVWEVHGQRLMEQQKPFEALNAWAHLTSQEAFAAHVPAALTLLAQQYQDAGQLDLAIWTLELLGDDASLARVQELHWQKGQQREAAGDRDGALAAYLAAGNHAAAHARWQELTYQQAQEKIAAKDFTSAWLLLDTIRGYSDVDTLLAKNSQIRKAEAAATLSRRVSAVHLRDTITFGARSGKPVEWLVLDQRGDKVMLMALEPVYCREPFAKKRETGNWSNSEMRKWLNKGFLTETFTKAETGAIVKTKLSTKYDKKNLSTTDQVFLLSLEEAQSFFSSKPLMMYTSKHSTRLRTAYGKYRYEVDVWYPASGNYKDGNITSSGSVMPVMWVNLAARNVDWASLTPTWGIAVKAQAAMDKGDYAAALDILAPYSTLSHVAPLFSECHYQLGMQALLRGELNTARQYLMTVKDYKLAGTLLSNLQGFNVAMARQFDNAKVKDVVVYGTYEQDNITSNGPEPLKWIVAARDGDRVLLVTEKIIDARAMGFSSTAKGKATWGDSKLRSWLNSTFLENFTDAERSGIAVTQVAGAGNDKSAPVEDQVFLLSYDEASRYNLTGAVGATAYAQANKLNEDNHWLLRDAVNKNTYSTNQAVKAFGRSIGDYASTDSTGGLRPAMWVDARLLESAPAMTLPAAASSAPLLTRSQLNFTEVLGKDIATVVKHQSAAGRTLVTTLTGAGETATEANVKKLKLTDGSLYCRGALAGGMGDSYIQYQFDARKKLTQVLVYVSQGRNYGQIEQTLEQHYGASATQYASTACGYMLPVTQLLKDHGVKTRLSSLWNPLTAQFSQRLIPNPDGSALLIEAFRSYDISTSVEFIHVDAALLK